MYYSQCEEDKFLNDNFFKNKKNGRYIELGALDGVLYSNTKFYEDEHNWSGILIEPHPLKFIDLQKNRSNNFLSNNLISCNTTPLTFRYFENNCSAVSGVENTLSKHHFDTYFESNNEWMKSQPQAKINIIPITLSKVIKDSNIKHFDFLSLDVEGHELEVLQSWDFSVLIDLILIENLETDKLKSKKCYDILINNGYLFVQKFKHNEIYVLPNIFL
jgi:FkbM family methyltransferase